MDSATADPTQQTPAAAPPAQPAAGGGNGASTPGQQPSAGPNWSDAATGASQPMTAAPPPAAPPKNATAQPVAAPPPTAQPVRPGGLRGFVDKMLDSMAGTDTSRVRKEPDGTLYLQHETPTRGQQWLRIAVEGLRGAAAGMAAGKGAGNQGKALEAGIEAGDKAQGQKEEDYKNQQLAVANSQALKHQMAANAFAMTRLQVKAAQEDIEFSEKRGKELEGDGGRPMGRVSQLTDLTKLMRDTPGFHDDQAQHDVFQPVQQYDENGKANGFEIYRMPQGWGEETTPPGTVFHVFNPILNGGKGGLEEQKTTEWTPKSKINSYEMAAGTASQDYALKAADVAAKQAEPGKTNAEAAEARATAAVKPSEAAKNYAEAGKDRAEAAAAGGENDQGTVDLIGQGRAQLATLSRMLSKNPQLLEAVTQKYPGFDGNKVQSYLKTYEDFTSGKTSTALNSGGVAFKHLQELRALNTVGSHVPGTPAYNAYQNKADTVATELAKFYGDSTVPGIAAIKSTLTSTLPGTRQAAISTQSKSMGDKMDQYEQQWKNAAPSAAYEAPLPGIGLEAKEARAALDPGYAQRLTVRLKAPNGEVSDVPYLQMRHYLDKGATVAEQ